jgi:stringent starvation protein B
MEEVEGGISPEDVRWLWKRVWKDLSGVEGISLESEAASESRLELGNREVRYEARCEGREMRVDNVVRCVTVLVSRDTITFDGSRL